MSTHLNRWIPSQGLSDPVLGSPASGVPNADGVILPSAAYPAATYNSTEFFNPLARGIRLFVNVTNANGGTVAVSVQVKDPSSGGWNTIATSAAFGTATQLRTLTVYPSGTAAAGSATTDTVITLPAGTAMRIQTVVATATVTFSLGAELLL